MNIFKSISFGIALLLATNLLAQPTLKVSSASGNQGQVVSVDINVDDFVNLIGLNLRMKWDSNVVEFVSVENITPELGGLQFATPSALPKGNLRANWFDFGGPTTLAQNTRLFSINFRLIGSVGSSTAVSILDDPNDDNDLEVISIDDPTINIGATIQNGTVQIIGAGNENLRLILPSQTVEEAENFCIPLRVQNFEDVKALQYNIQWDPTVISFTGIDGMNLPSLDLSDFNNTSGQSRLVWFSGDPNGITLANNSTIYELCFQAVGGGGSTTSLSFSDLVTEPEASTTNGSVRIQGAIEGFAFIASNGEGQLGDVQCLDITVNDFDAVTAFQFSLNWDSTIFKFDNITNVHPDLESILNFGTPGAQNVRQGQITAAWFDSATSTLPDGTVIFTLCLRAPTGNCGDKVDVRFSNMPTSILVATSSGQLPMSDINLIDGSVTISCGPKITVDEIRHPDCNGESTGAIFVTVTPPGNYEFRWNGNLQTGEDLENVPAGNYQLEVTDLDLNETFTIDVIQLINPAAIFIDGTVTDATPGANDGAISTTVNGGTGQLSCSWNPGGSTDCDGLIGLAPGTYTLTVIDANDCVEEKEFQVKGGAETLRISADSVTNASCAESNTPQCDGGFVITILEGIGPFSYTINGNNFNGTATELCAGVYTVVVNDAGLNMNETIMVTVGGPQPIEVELDITQPSGPEEADGQVIIANITGGVPPYDIVWVNTNSDTLSQVGPGLYLLTVLDNNGCMYQDMIQLISDSDRCFKGNPVITPNGDGRNDQLVITCSEFFDTQLKIYNRWGQLVYRDNQYENTWVGVDLEGLPVEDGVYFWVIQAVLSDGTRKEAKGHVNLFRNLR